MDNLSLLTVSYADADLNSASSTRTCAFVWPSEQSEQSPISLLRCTDPLAACLAMQEFSLVSFNHPDFFCPGIVRMEDLHLHLLPKHKDGKSKAGWMLLGEDAAFLNGNRSLPVTILATIIPGDPNVRWFYTLLSITNLLRQLDNNNLIHLHATWFPGAKHHQRFSTYLHESFLAAITIPHAPDYLTAQQITDYCPPILDADTALQRLERNEHLHFAICRPLETLRDLSDDRYLHHLHPAEREAASIANLPCATYLLLKRRYFRAFFEDIYRSDKDIDPAASALASRTEAAVATAAAATTTVPPLATPARGVAMRTSPAAASSSSSRRRTAAAENGTGAGQGEPVTPVRSLSAAGGPAGSAGGGGGGSGSVANAKATTPLPPLSGSARRGNTGRSDPRRRVRTEKAHHQILEHVYKIMNSRARMLVTVWRELGFLDEGRYLDWVREGGVLESIGLREEEGSADGGEAECGDGGLVPSPLAARRRLLNV